MRSEKNPYKGVIVSGDMTFK